MYPRSRNSKTRYPVNIKKSPNAISLFFLSLDFTRPNGSLELQLVQLVASDANDLSHTLQLIKPIKLPLKIIPKRE